MLQKSVKSIFIHSPSTLGLLGPGGPPAAAGLVGGTCRSGKPEKSCSLGSRGDVWICSFLLCNVLRSAVKMYKEKICEMLMTKEYPNQRKQQMHLKHAQHICYMHVTMAIIIGAVVDTMFVNIYVTTKHIPTCRYNIQHIDRRTMEK